MRQPFGEIAGDIDVVEFAQCVLQVLQSLVEASLAPGVAEKVREQLGCVAGLLRLDPQVVAGFRIKPAQMAPAALTALPWWINAWRARSGLRAPVIGNTLANASIARAPSHNSLR